MKLGSLFRNTIPTGPFGIAQKIHYTNIHYKNPYMRRYTAGSKPMPRVLTGILNAVKEEPQKYCNTAYARSGVNQVWILKHSKELLEPVNKTYQRHIWLYDRGDYNQFRHKLSQANWDQVFVSNNVNECAEKKLLILL